ncbi:hypothetical protein [Streptomyces sp. NPDC088762]|uniref:hypothetical protein n=1 Tax=Streptomyces sp. NPDC088762 TaxID=3365891 RepID=UPI00382A8B56
MIPRHRQAPVVTALVAGLFALTACGATHAGDTAGTPSAPPVLTSPAPDPSAAAAAARAAHDEAFPEVAARCAGSGPATAGSSGGPAPLPTDPEAAKHAENNAFKQKRPLTGEARCRGDAHAQRIKKALTGPGVTVPATEAELVAALTRLGYEPVNGSVYRTGGALGFSYLVPGTGPCVTGWFGSPAKVEAHGVYMEGGCTEPRGGH